jgi:hypothetical protein
MFLQQFSHDIILLLDLGFELLDLLVLCRFLSLDVVGVWFSLEDDSAFFKELLLPLTRVDTGTPSSRCSLTIAIFCSGVKNLRFDIAVLPSGTAKL